ncbi:MAG: hypothetical protein ACRD3W_09400, partial [Terriglobales bacterium]
MELESSPMSNIRPKPIAVCTRCHGTYRVEGIHHICGRIIDRKMCGGGIISAIQEDDWDECPSCKASGD